MLPINRRQFLTGCSTLAVTTWVGSEVAVADSGPALHFPSQPRQRIAIASYPFRDFILGSDNSSTSKPRMELKDFAAHIQSRFNINKIEPWSDHFLSTQPKYLEEIRTAVEKAGAAIVNIAVDGEYSPYATDRTERDKAVASSKQWVDVAITIGSPGIRTNLPPAGSAKPNINLAAESLLRVVEYASAKKVVISLENDNPVSEDPFFLVKLIEKVNNPWLHTLPDFANTLAAHDPKYAYEGIDAMFGKAYSICHVKAAEANAKGEIVHVDMAKTFGFMKQHAYKGYCSMEFDSPGDPYKGTAELIDTTLQYLS